MTSSLLIIPIITSFLLTLFFIPLWIKKAKQIGLLWKDMNKYEEKYVSGSGGLIVVCSFIIGALLYTAYRVFILKSLNSNLVEILALLNVVILLAGLGFIDDLLGWRKGGLSRRTRLLLLGVSSIPLIAINAGKSLVSLPLLGQVELGLLYPLIFIPIGVIGTTAFNFIAGHNGLEAGQGILILSALAILAFHTDSSWLTVIALIMVASLLASLFYNFFPAKVFPGDVLTYPIAGLIASMAILGNFEKIAVFFFIPYILETILKTRGKLKRYSFGEPQPDGSLDLKYKKIYGLEHMAIWLMKKYKVKPTEKKVVLYIWTFQIFIILLGFIIFRGGIFQ